MAQNVTEDRDKYIGGSDVPTIMGINPFKTRDELLLEKAGLVENNFVGNLYTEYGNILEPKIRKYISDLMLLNFEETRTIKGKYRYHSDGEAKPVLLEIKTTSQVKEKVDDYIVYLVQLLFGMYITENEKGVLSVYRRPVDFDWEFDKNRLQIFYIEKSDYGELIDKILKEVELFLIDLEYVKEYGKLPEKENNKEVEKEISEYLELENNKLEIEKEKDKLLASTKVFEAVKYLEEQALLISQQQELMKEKIKNAMEKTKTKKFENDLVSITYVAPTIRKGVDTDKLKTEYSEIYAKVLKETPVKSSIRLKVKGE